MRRRNVARYEALIAKLDNHPGFIDLFGRACCRWDAAIAAMRITAPVLVTVRASGVIAIVFPSVVSARGYANRSRERRGTLGDAVVSVLPSQCRRLPWFEHW